MTYSDIEYSNNWPMEC